MTGPGVGVMPADFDAKAGEQTGPPAATGIPVSTYRLQLNQKLTFAEAARFIPYLRGLGISHCYASPYLKARPGSSHGYDIVDHGEINPEIGSYESFERFILDLRRCGMGLITDIVPNHMAVMGCDNLWWLDVLENGQASAYASFFDIDWRPIKKALQNKILVPVLGGPYGDILAQQELKLVFDADQGQFNITYYQHCFPVDPQTYPFILNSQHEQLRKSFASDDPAFLEYQSLENGFGKLPLRSETAPEKIEERGRDKEVFKKHLARLCAENLAILEFIALRIEEISRAAGELHTLLEQQVYRLAYWRVAGDEINYRRFFDINFLAGLRIEDDKVFDATHRFILSLFEQGKIHGFRIDHADGLYDPAAYYQRLIQKMAAILKIEAEPDTPPVYVVAEKIVANYEYLSSDWPIHGTTGYEFANIVNGVFINHAAEQPMTRFYFRFIRERLDFGELVYRAKKLVMVTNLASGLNVLANQLSHLAEADSRTRDYTLNGLRDALAEVIACFPVYRTYINSPPVCKRDSQYIHWAVEKGKQRSDAADKTVFDFIRGILLLENSPAVPTRELLKFVMKFQQYTAPVMAKGSEDTALYRYHRLISLNEVGGDPGHFGHSVNAFHYFNQERIRKWPHSLLSLSTHDSKHSADMRARINVLSEIPQKWQESVSRWGRLNKSSRSKTQQIVIARNDKYLFYQVLAGTWPLAHSNDSDLAAYRERIRNYLIKAVREAKQRSSWINPDEEYEQAVLRFVDRSLDSNSLFLKDFIEFERQIRKPGLYNALAQTVLLLTSPGVPDIYQGEELWQFNLVDPDNRRPVDFETNHRLLNEVDAMLAAADIDRPRLLGSLLANIEDGRIKLFVVMMTLRFRLDHAVLFRDGEYLKINVQGKRAEHLVAFARRDQNAFAVIVVPRLMATLLDSESDARSDDLWNDTRLDLPPAAPGAYRELFSQRRVAAIAEEPHLHLEVGEVLESFPLAILSAPP